MKQFKEELNQEQQNVFEQICIGNNKDHSKEIVKYLQDLGFVEIKDYYPYPTKEIYEQWQNWCRTFDINDIQTDNYGNFYFANNSNNKQKSLYISEEEDLISESVKSHISTYIREKTILKKNYSIRNLSFSF